ncbi:MAG: hypothetical protein CMH13_11180 [Martelella sp.]|uniref:hypothetical protein n=1 Tax=Martelella sp. TaxID=1969699 RepID=UPI000C66D7F0|nr:hypothetical protein [Martelella sp.]MAU21082.1 hypothetical protein [Martelella sp.]|tara:strand:+ start:1426 stop:1689 length:264 start_codon:yes stop_codon:yes gene_type:complete
MPTKIRSTPVPPSSSRLTKEKVALIKLLLAAGLPQHKIAAICDVNQGRVSEINTRKLFADAEADQFDLFRGAGDLKILNDEGGTDSV